MDIRNFKLLFLRHLETKSNKEKIFSGQLDIEILSFHREIKQIELITAFEIDNIQVFCSPLKRCLQTIDVLQNNINHNFESTIISDTLKERNFGIWQGQEKKKIKKEFNTFFPLEKFDYKLTPLGGESYDEIYHRVQQILNLIKANEGKPILICSHNHIMKILIQVIFDFDKNFWYNFEFENGKLYSLQYFEIFR